MLHLKAELNDREEAEISQELDWKKKKVLQYTFAEQPLQSWRSHQSLIHVPSTLTLTAG